MMKINQYARENMDKLSEGIDGMYLLATGIIDSGGVRVSKLGSSDQVKRKLLDYIAASKEGADGNSRMLRYKCYFTFEEIES